MANTLSNGWTPQLNSWIDLELNDAAARLQKDGTPFSIGMAAFWLNRHAAISSKQYRHPHGVFPLERGQLVFPYRAGIIHWGWGKAKTENFLRQLEGLGEIKISQQPYTFKQVAGRINGRG